MKDKDYICPGDFEKEQTVATIIAVILGLSFLATLGYSFWLAFFLM